MKVQDKISLGDRMKTFYENITKYRLSRRTYTIIRLDGKAFHTFTRRMNKPFDCNLIDCMDRTAQYLVKNIQGAKFAYVQSDEISILLTDFEKFSTEPWLGGIIQKIVSISASMATGAFNRSFISDSVANFDSRTFTIPTKTEINNYFIWRRQDWLRNSIQLVGQANFSHKQLHKKSIEEIKEMLREDDSIKNWENYNDSEKFGRIITPTCKFSPLDSTDFLDLIPEQE